jgi:hypothetical protein
MNLTGNRAVLDAVMEKAEDFIANVLLHMGEPSRPTVDFRLEHHPWVAAAFQDMRISNPVRDEGIAVSTQVAYTGEGGRLYDVGEPVKGSVSVVSHYLTTGGFIQNLIKFILHLLLSTHVVSLLAHTRLHVGCHPCKEWGIWGLVTIFQ